MYEFQKRLSNSFYALISLPATAMGFALSVQISALSWLLTTQYHLDIHQVGIVWAAGPLAGIIGQVVIGLISDRVWFWGGRRRPFIIIGGVLAAAMLLALPNIHVIDGWLGVGNLLLVAIVVALTLDLAINISFNPTRSIIADVTPEGDARTKGYTWMQTISGFFGVLAYVIGAVSGNFVLIAFAVALVLLFSIIPVLFITENRVLGAAQAAGAEATAQPRSTQWGQLLRLFGAHAFSWIGAQTMFVYIIAFILQKIPLPDDPGLAAGESGRIIAISFAILNTVGFLLPAPVLEPLAHRFGRVIVHTVAVGIMAAGYFGLVTAGSTPMMVYILMAVVGVGWASMVSLPFAIMSEKVAPGRMGFFMGMFNLSVVIPQLFVSLFLGSVIQDAADKTIIFIISGVALAASTLVWTFVRDGRRTMPRPVQGGGH
ncbi:MAG TPA: MFS transporter [Bacteroidota bacterium]|nr:MFS transporter [Bacteroidota bacterium]